MEGWFGVELRHLAALAAVNEERSFRGAADRLGYVQSAVSQQIAHLERLVGARLVERSRGHSNVELSEAGHLLLHHAERMHWQLGAAYADLKGLAEEDGSTLHVGVTHSLVSALLPRALSLLAEGDRGGRVHIVEAARDGELLERLARGELDAAVAELPIEEGPFERRDLLVDPLVLVAQAGSAITHLGESVKLEDIAAQPLVWDPSWRMMELVEAQLKATGLEVDRRYEASAGAAQALVGAGLGVAIMPRLVVDLDDPSTTAMALDGLLPARTLTLAWQRDRHSRDALDAFLDAMLLACDRHRRDVRAIQLVA